MLLSFLGTPQEVGTPDTLHLSVSSAGISLWTLHLALSYREALCDLSSPTQMVLMRSSWREPTSFKADISVSGASGEGPSDYHGLCVGLTLTPCLQGMAGVPCSRAEGACRVQREAEES